MNSNFSDLLRCFNDKNAEYLAALGDARVRVLIVNGHFVMGSEFSARFLGGGASL
jgi:hypothetical protein